MGFNLKTYLAEKTALIDQALKTKWLPPENTQPQILHQAMRYSLLAPGKRIRPVLALASSEVLDMPQEDVLPIAVALEMIHVFSLIHDDLPAMDNDSLRRGQPTNHKVYGEAIAILAGDNLLAGAFIPLADLSTTNYSARNILKVIKKTAEAVGSAGMIAGQVMDIKSQGQAPTLDELKNMHRYKTGALIRLAVEAPAILCGTDDLVRRSLAAYGDCVGLAFQIADDILDVEGGRELGKDVGSDIKNNKATYPALMGLENARKEAQAQMHLAIEALSRFDASAEPLRHLARFAVERKY